MLIAGWSVLLGGLLLGAFHVGQHRQCEWNRAHHTIHVERYCGP